MHRTENHDFCVYFFLSALVYWGSQSDQNPSRAQTSVILGNGILLLHLSHPSCQVVRNAADFQDWTTDWVLFYTLYYWCCNWNRWGMPEQSQIGKFKVKRERVRKKKFRNIRAWVRTKGMESKCSPFQRKRRIHIKVWAQYSKNDLIFRIKQLKIKIIYIIFI